MVERRSGKTAMVSESRGGWHPQPNNRVHVAAEKASILRVQVPSCQLPDSGT